MPSKPPGQPPGAAKRPLVRRYHGIELVDDYAWLKADNWLEVLERPSRLPRDIRAHLKAEKAYTAALLADTEELQETLRAEMLARLVDNDSSVPEVDGPWEYYSRFTAGAEYPVLCRRPRGGGPETVLLDGNVEAHGKVYWSLEGSLHSPDHRLLAYAVDPNGSERCRIRIRDLATGKDLPDRLSGSSADIVWGRDSRTLFYVRLDAQQRPLLAYRHRLGRRVSTDVLVYQEHDPTFEVSLSQTQSGAFIVIESWGHDTSEVRLIDADTPQALPRLVEPRQPGHEYAVEHYGDSLIITTNSGGALDYRLCTAPLVAPQQDGWQEIVPHRPGRRILEVVAYAQHLVRLEQEDGLPRIVVRRWRDGSEHEISYAEEVYQLELVAGLEFGTGTTRFIYSSMTTPEQVYDYHLESRSRELRQARVIPAGHDPADYVSRRLAACTSDGERVPVSLLYHKDTPLDGSAPLYLYGYGSYGVSTPADFSAERLSLVKRGFIYALAHVRGGDERGHAWYLAGRHQAKRNTFTDFIAVARSLIDLGYTRQGRIIASGDSAGGMLVGAVANMAPELFLAIIADVPFVDVLNTLLDADLPMTPGEWPEWGNPLENKDDFALILSYSPYENVTRQAYPHILVNASLSDARVTYWEPAKWVARLRDRKTDDHLLLLNVNMDAGHGGASGRLDQLKALALDYAFALKVAGISSHNGRSMVL